MRVFCSRKITLTLLYGAARLHEGHSHSKPCSTPGRTTRGASPNRAVSYAPEAHRRSLCNFHSKPCSLSLRSVAIRGTEISVSVRVGEEMKNDKLITLKLMLQRRTGSHSVFFECGFEYARFTLAFSSHAPEAHKLKLMLQRRTGSHSVFLCVPPSPSSTIF
jgi:hypothetical protein